MLTLVLAVALSQDAGAVARLRWEPRVDLPVTGAALAAWLVTELPAKAALAPDACRWCEPNAFDTGVRRLFNPSLTPSPSGLAGPDLASNLLLVATPMVMLGLDALLAWRDGALGEVPVDLVLIAEATLVAMGLTQAVKFAVGRARPYTVGASAEQLGEGNDHFVSFFSGHTSFVFAAVAATGVVATQRGYRLAWLTWAVGVPLAAATGVARLAADKHWAATC